MLETNDQLLLLQLLAATVIYLNESREGNPFVKKLSNQKENEAKELITNIVNNLQHLFPLIDQINNALQESITVENKEVTDIKNYI